MPVIYLLVNPRSGRGTGSLTADKVHRLLQARGHTVTRIDTTSPDHVGQVVAQMPSSCVLACLGGDGFINLVVRGLMNRPVDDRPLLFPLPAGRGNDFVRSLGLPRDTAAVIDAALPLIPAHETGRWLQITESHSAIRHVDVAFANGLPFLGVLSLGFTARANAIANQLPIKHAATYTLSGVVELLRARRTLMQLTVDGRVTHHHCWGFDIGNSGRFGAGLRIHPGATPHDGRLHIAPHETNRAGLALELLLARTGRQTSLPYVTHTSTRGPVQIAALPQQVVFADGDPLTHTPVTITMAPRALHVLAPK